MLKGETHLDVGSVLCEFGDFCKNSLCHRETEFSRLDTAKVGGDSVSCVGVLRERNVFRNCLVLEKFLIDTWSSFISGYGISLLRSATGPG